MQISMDEIDKDIISNPVSIFNQNFDSSILVLISPTRSMLCKQQFLKEADTLYIEAKRSTIATNTLIPPWFIVMTVALGWNEIMAILRNPMLSFFFLIAMAIAYFIWFTDLGGPISSVIKAGSLEAFRQGKTKLKEKGVDVDQFTEKAQDFVTNIYTPKKPRTKGIEMTKLKPE